MEKILYGTNVVDFYKEKIKKEIEELGEKPKLAIIVADGYSDASSIYVRNKHKLAAEVGIDVIEHKLEWKNISENTFKCNLLRLLAELNDDNNIDGIIVQLPCPYISEDMIASLINPKKDVDGFGLKNLGAVVRGVDGLYPCTPEGALLLLDYHNIEIEGKVSCVIGRSNILGKPLANMLINRGGTVISCNSKTPNIKEKTKLADIVFLATGNPKMFNSSYFKKDAIVIDFGMNKDENNKLCGDLDIEDSKNILKGYTPTPKGTGPLTVLVLMMNTLKSYKNKKGSK